MNATEDKEKGYQPWIDFFVSQLADADAEDAEQEDVNQPVVSYTSGNKR